MAVEQFPGMDVVSGGLPLRKTVMSEVAGSEILCGDEGVYQGQVFRPGNYPVFGHPRSSIRTVPGLARPWPVTGPRSRRARAWARAVDLVVQPETASSSDKQTESHAQFHSNNWKS